MQFISARPSLMRRSMPTSTAMPTATVSAENKVPPNACSDAVRVTRPAPLMPAAPLEVRTIRAARAICWPRPMSCPDREPRHALDVATVHVGDAHVVVDDRGAQVGCGHDPARAVSLTG
jgi:hypothetical protein